MKIGVDGLKLPGARAIGCLGCLDLASDMGLAGVFFSTILDMSGTLDPGVLQDVRAKADDLELYLEAGLGKVNPYSSAEAPEVRAIGDGDIALGFRRMMEAAAAIGCRDLWISMGNFKPAYAGRLAVDRFRTDVDWPDQLAATEKFLRRLAPVARDLGIHMNMETHDEITSFEIIRMIEAVGADVMGVVFDTANGLQRGEHPLWATRRLAPFVRQTHIRNAYVAYAPGGLDFQPRPLRDGIVDFASILPILAAANPGLHLSLESEYSVDDRRRPTGSRRQCIQIFDPLWLSGHPDMTITELAAYWEAIQDYEIRIRRDAIPSWEAYESLLYGYPSYQQQSFDTAAARSYIEDNAAFLRAICSKLGV